MGWGDVIKAGITSVGDDIFLSNTGRAIKQGIIDDAINVASKTPNISAEDAMDIMKKAYVDSDDFYKSFTAKNGITPDEYANAVDTQLYKIGRGLAHTGNFTKQVAPVVGMNALFMAPMALPYLIQPQQQEY